MFYTRRFLLPTLFQSSLQLPLSPLTLPLSRHDVLSTSLSCSPSNLTRYLCERFAPPKAPTSLPQLSPCAALKLREAGPMLWVTEHCDCYLKKLSMGVVYGEELGHESHSDLAGR